MPPKQQRATNPSGNAFYLYMPGQTPPLTLILTLTLTLTQTLTLPPSCAFTVDPHRVHITEAEVQAVAHERQCQPHLKGARPSQEEARLEARLKAHSRGARGDVRDVARSAGQRGFELQCAPRAHAGERPWAWVCWGAAS